jgi:hypothetical protein
MRDELSQFGTKLPEMISIWHNERMFQRIRKYEPEDLEGFKLLFPDEPKQTIKMKHTQGEWEHVIEKDGMNNNDVIKHNNQYIATIHVTGSGKEWNANAKLIAAAPDLLRALEMCVKLLYACRFNSNDDQVAEAEAAIKKATELKTEPTQQF